ncbi:MAG: DUF4010 domain-containing protein [Bacteroidota bacterium]
MEELNTIPKSFYDFLLVTVFSLIIGLAQRRLHSTVAGDEKRLFGTDRTFTFIGILGFILFQIFPGHPEYYLGGGFALLVFLGIYYYSKTSQLQDYGLTTIIIALITYCLAPMIITQDRWFSILIIVIVLIMTEIKESLMLFSKKFDRDEFLTLSKFLVIAGVILPVLPNKEIIVGIDITPYKIWLAIVIISSISYISYLIQKFIFRESGIIITGILSGLYSSTATTVVMSRKSKDNPELASHFATAIMLAIAMMYIRILVLVLIFNQSLGIHVAPWFLILFVASLITAWIVFKRGNKYNSESRNTTFTTKNPLEFKVALLFMFMYVAFTFITNYTVINFGSGGLNVLSVIIGVTDIDPFLMSLFQGTYDVPQAVIVFATMQAIISNNILKTVYCVTLGSKATRKLVVPALSAIIVLNILIEIVYAIIY